MTTSVIPIAATRLLKTEPYEASGTAVGVSLPQQQITFETKYLRLILTLFVFIGSG